MRSGVEDDAACDTIYQLKEKIYVSLIFSIFLIFLFFDFPCFVLTSPLPYSSSSWPSNYATCADKFFQKVTIILQPGARVYDLCPLERTMAHPRTSPR